MTDMLGASTSSRWCNGNSYDDCLVCGNLLAHSMYDCNDSSAEKDRKRASGIGKLETV